ncbi:MAG TPA: GAF domain-containing protein [Chthoniobacterales bacterium]|nr:GAF domain-containing protein [Chthoniobacterales bacterium]
MQSPNSKCAIRKARHPMGAKVNKLDLFAVVTASQAVSGVIVLDKLIETLMAITIEHAGAERGFLILPQDGRSQIVAEAIMVSDKVEVHLLREPVGPSVIPESILHYVVRTGQKAILDDASAPNPFSDDEYLQRRRPRSILCLPITKQAELMGMLYLENNLTPGAFTADRQAVLELLASQAAISLENARLFADLTQENNERKRAEQAVRAGQEELNRLNRTLQTLYQCNRALVHATDEHELLQSVCQILVSDGRLQLAWVGRCENDAAKTVRPVAKAGKAVDYLEHARISWSGRTKFGRGPSGVALRTGKPCWIKDARIDAVFAPWRSAAIARGYVSCVALPLIAGECRIGSLSLYSKEPNAFNENTIGQYTDLANSLAYGVLALRTREERKRALETSHERAIKLAQANEVLRRSLNALARHKNLQGFVDQVLVVISEQLGGHSSSLWLIDVEQRKGYLRSICQNGRVIAGEQSDHPNAREPHEWSSDDPSWLALQKRRPFLHYDLFNNSQDRHTTAQRAYLSNLGVKSVVWIPLVFGEQLVGMLSVRLTVVRQIDDEELDFAQALAQQVTLALELARLAEQAKQTALVVERERAARERATELAKANEALRECLDALASVPELDEFLGQVMGAITRQLGAMSSVLRWRNQQQNCLALDFVYQDGQVMTPTEANYPKHLQSIPLDERQVRMLRKPATVLHPLDSSSSIPDSLRTYLAEIGAKTLLIIPLIVAGQLIGSLTFRFAEDREFRPEEIEIARALATQASLAIQLTRLANSARQSAVLAERNELAGEIHDTLAQFFTGISMQLGAAIEVNKAGNGNIQSYLERASDLSQFGLVEARRSAFSLQPAIIEESGLIDALRKLAERSNIPGRLRCNCHSNGVREECLTPSVQQELLRIAQEAMSNAVRHAKPTVIRVNLRCKPPTIILEVTDNGSGIADSRAASREGLGLSNMRARAENIGAKLEVRTAVGRGTSIVVSVPMNC